MQRAKARASPNGPTAKRFKAESSPNAARTRMTQTPKRRKEHNEEEEEEEDEGSPVAKRNKASDLTVAPTPIPQGTEEEELVDEHWCVLPRQSFRASTMAPMTAASSTNDNAQKGSR